MAGCSGTTYIGSFQLGVLSWCVSEVGPSLGTSSHNPHIGRGRHIGSFLKNTNGKMRDLIGTSAVASPLPEAVVPSDQLFSRYLSPVTSPEGVYLTTWPLV
jgi:hypothetical protein